MKIQNSKLLTLCELQPINKLEVKKEQCLSQKA